MARKSRPESGRPEAAPRRATLAIDAIGVAGDGVGRDDGALVYVPLTAPGDIADVEIVKERGGERGRLRSLVTASPHRAAPRCGYFGSCGGCALQHVDDAFALDWKRRRVVDALAREGLTDVVVAPTLPTAPASRRRATFAVRKTGEGALLGFNERHSSAIVSLDACPVLTPAFSASLPGLRAFAAALPARGFDLAVTAADNGLDVSIVGARINVAGAALAGLMAAARKAGVIRLSEGRAPIFTIEAPRLVVGGLSLTPPPGAFLQASAEAEAILARLAAEGLGKARKIVDLFAGCGAFALALGRQATVTAIDVDEGALAALSQAARAAQAAGDPITPIAIEARDLFERPLRAGDFDRFDAALFDPPRAGAEAQARELARSRLKTIVGVSCNPTTFARDAAILRAGGYTLSQVTPVDQFVYAPHVELVGVFRRRSGG